MRAPGPSKRANWPLWDGRPVKPQRAETVSESSPVSSSVSFALLVLPQKLRRRPELPAGPRLTKSAWKGTAGNRNAKFPNAKGNFRKRRQAKLAHPNPHAAANTHNPNTPPPSTARIPVLRLACGPRAPQLAQLAEEASAWLDEAKTAIMKCPSVQSSSASFVGVSHTPSPPSSAKYKSHKTGTCLVHAWSAVVHTHLPYMRPSRRAGRNGWRGATAQKKRLPFPLPRFFFLHNRADNDDDQCDLSGPTARKKSDGRLEEQKASPTPNRSEAQGA